MKTILLADDKKNIRQFCQRELEEEGYRVLLACDGTEVLRMFRQEYPDLVILDICMPSLNGLETIERIQAIDTEVPVIFFTAYDEDCLQDQRRRFAAACVEKSEDLGELKLAIRRILAERRRPEPLRLGLPPEG
jgi:two-component system, response regulator, stage 0 sporulation protein F